MPNRWEALIYTSQEAAAANLAQPLGFPREVFLAAKLVTIIWQKGWGEKGEPPQKNGEFSNFLCGWNNF